LKIRAFTTCVIVISFTIPVNKSSLTTIDIFQLKILANRQRINVNWYSFICWIFMHQGKFLGLAFIFYSPKPTLQLQKMIMPVYTP
jgi:hypothetical protein